MPENVRSIIYRFSRELKHILGDKLTKAIVYGSYARGDFRENSDIDIMILVKMSDEEIRLVKNDIYDLAFEFEIRLLYRGKMINTSKMPVYRVDNNRSLAYYYL